MTSESTAFRRRLRLVPALERATHAVGMYVQAQAGPRCTQAEANVLAFLYERGGSPLAEVHASFGHRRSTLTSVIDRLAARNLVVRKRDPEDGRAYLLSLTRSGTTLGRAVTARLEELEARASSRLTKRDVASFAKVAAALAVAARGHQPR